MKNHKESEGRDIMGKPEPEKQYFLSMSLDAEDNAFVDEYASLRKASRATAIRQLLHDHLPAMIRALKYTARRVPPVPKTEPAQQTIKAAM